jgi:hypothetical protein
MEASQHSLLAACFTLDSINATLAIVPQRGTGLWIKIIFTSCCKFCPLRVFIIIVASHIESALCCSPFNESEHSNVRNKKHTSLDNRKPSSDNSDHKVSDKGSKRITKGKCDKSSKHEDEDSDSDEKKQLPASL